MRRTAAASDVSKSLDGAALERERHDAAIALIESHDAVFRRTARRYSLCADDGEDAYQRALEILLTKAPPIEHEALVRWMQTVTKHEALAVRRQRERVLSPVSKNSDGEERDPLAGLAWDGPGPTDRAASRERIARSREALRALKPQEVRALSLKAEGFSYAEIGAITGWTYTKINRCMAEGRKRFLAVFSEIEEGRRCERYEDDLSALSDNELQGSAAEDLRVHLTACSSCRAMLAVYRGLPEKILALSTPLAAQPSMVERVHGWAVDHIGTLGDRVREGAHGLVGRPSASDGATQAAAVGGTRGAGTATLAKLLAVCGATAAGGAACVATGVVDVGALGSDNRAQPAPIDRPSRPPQKPVKVEPPPPDRPPARDPEQVKPEPTPTPAEQTQQQFGFESSSSSTGSGGGEFGVSGSSSGGGSSTGGGGSSGQFGFEN